MKFSSQGQLREQVSFLRRQYLQDGVLPFGDILTDDFVKQAMNAVDGVWKDRIRTVMAQAAATHLKQLRMDGSTGDGRLVQHPAEKDKPLRNSSATWSRALRASGSTRDE